MRSDHCTASCRAAGGRAETLSAVALTAVLATSGTLHFLSPRAFVAIVPKRLPAKEALVAVSGAAELACAALLLHPRTRRAGGVATATLFAAVFPANVSMALRSTRRSWRYRVLAWARLPLQLPLIGWALAQGRIRPANR